MGKRKAKHIEPTFEDLAKLEDRLRAIKWDQQKCLEELRLLNAREAARAEQARRAEARRYRLRWLAFSLAGVVMGLLGLFSSKRLASTVFALLESRNSEVLTWLCYGFRALSAAAYLVPASISVAKAKIPKQVRILLVGAIAGGCLFGFGLLNKQVISELDSAFSLGSFISTPLLLLLLSRTDFSSGYGSMGKAISVGSEQESPLN